MSLLEKPFLGNLVDTEDSDQDQSDYNAYLLKETDRFDLIYSINKRISESLLKFFIDKLDLNDIEYFNIILNQIAKSYKLNYLKLYKYNLNKKSEFIQNIILLLIYLKITLMNIIELKKINKNITRDEFEDFLNKNNAPILFIESIKFIDKYNYEKFINRIFNEVEYDFFE